MPRIAMPFGAHAGKHPEDVPSDYLRWFLENVERQSDELIEECEAQLRARAGEGIPRRSR